LTQLASDPVWINGPSWLSERSMEETDQLAEMPDECAKELKAHERRQVRSSNF
jgi:hypothetical protein